MDGRPALALLAAAKINLALHVTGRREDGYHLLDSIVVFADVGDRVAIAPADRLSLELSGRFADHAPGDATDLAWRAAEAFYAHAGMRRSVAIRIEKAIPAGAGLGGGSADAAAVLTGLNRLHGCALSQQELAAIGLKLGADVPMCLAGTALRARGIGEALDPMRGWPALPLVLVWPGCAVSTPAAFARLARRDNCGLPDPVDMRTPRQMAEWLQTCRNDLEGPALRIAPDIGDALDELRATPGCLLARMSGSGSGCFALYSEPAEAERAASTLRLARPTWWVSAAVAGSPP